MDIIAALSEMLCGHSRYCLRRVFFDGMLLQYFFVRLFLFIIQHVIGVSRYGIGIWCRMCDIVFLQIFVKFFSMHAVS